MHPSSAHELDAVDSLIAGLPRDQALGLRLLALARAAAAGHLAESTTRAWIGSAAHESNPHEQVLRSQAAGLLSSGGPR